MPHPTSSTRSRVKGSGATTADHTHIPDPFTRAPPALHAFLATLDRRQVYITHVDRHAAAFKRRIFLVPLLLNLSLAALLAWRAAAAAPFYARVALHLLGHADTGTTIEPARVSWRDLLAFSLRRAGTFALDFGLVRVVAGWPWTFFLEGPHNPCSWRWRVGFQKKEVVVRVSRGWGSEDLLRATAVRQGGGGGGAVGRRDDDGAGAGDASASPFFKVRVLPAIEKNYVREKTGYLMMGKDWDLDFPAMVEAHRKLDAGELTMEAFEKAVWVWCEKPGTKALPSRENGEWCGWEVWKLDESVDTEGRKKIVEFKDRLTLMGKESLFFRWVELVQFASSQPGGFTPERQAEAMRNAKQMFEEQGVDFDELAASMGGVGGMPGFDRG